ncbi:MAG: hypothetical protein AAB886_01570, partial [Patescibacteria group bacterium]
MACLSRDWRQAAFWFAEGLAPEVLERLEIIVGRIENEVDALFQTPPIAILADRTQFGVKPLAARRDKHI